MCIKHRKVAVTSPWANGLVKQVNHFLKDSLTKLCQTTDEWKSNLGKMQYIINNTYYNAIKSTPSRLMLGYDQRNHNDFSLSQFTQALTSIDQNIDIERSQARYSTADVRNVKKL